MAIIFQVCEPNEDIQEPENKNEKIKPIHQNFYKTFQFSKSKP